MIGLRIFESTDHLSDCLIKGKLPNDLDIAFPLCAVALSVSEGGRGMFGADYLIVVLCQIKLFHTIPL